VGIQRPDGPYSVEMTAGPAWPGADENTYRDRADELRATLRSLTSTTEQWEQQRATLFNGDLVWSGEAATAAATEVDKRTAAMHTLQDQLRAAATKADTTAAVIGAVKTQITENVETAQKIIDQINNTPAATAEQKSAAIQQVVTTTHATNTEAVAAGAAQLGAAPPATPLNFGPTPHTPSPRTMANETDMSSGDITTINDANMKLLGELEKEYKALPDGQIKTDRLADIAAIRKALAGGPDRHLLYLARPDDPSQMIPAATVVGDPFTADHRSVTVPGVSSTTRGALVAMTNEASELRRQALAIARISGDSTKPTNVATIAWTGYQPPPNLGSVTEVSSAGLARTGAEKLDAFLTNLNSASHRPGQTTALFGHSYGSLVSGLALRDGASSQVTNAVLYGSPGFAATSTAKLGMTDDNFFVMTAPGDLIAPVGALAPLHGWGSDPNEIIWGNEPRYRFPHLQTEAGWVQVPIAGSDGVTDLYKTGTTGHSGYPQNAMDQMTGFNLAAILLDRPDIAVKEQPFS
jgi:ABC-type transporter Mla subunit MlaD